MPNFVDDFRSIFDQFSFTSSQLELFAMRHFCNRKISDICPENGVVALSPPIAQSGGFLHRRGISLIARIHALHTKQRNGNKDLGFFQWPVPDSFSSHGLRRCERVSTENSETRPRISKRLGFVKKHAHSLLPFNKNCQSSVLFLEPCTRPTTTEPKGGPQEDLW